LADTFLNLSGWHKVNFLPIDALKEDHNFRWLGCCFLERHQSWAVLASSRSTGDIVRSETLSKSLAGQEPTNIAGTGSVTLWKERAGLHSRVCRPSSLEWRHSSQETLN
jgi:hypothetical protein